jgi:Prp18 domain
MSNAMLNAQMVNFMKEGEFVKAHDVYMLTAIGNAPWPIGLTMVGIHERSGREKVGHMLSCYCAPSICQSGQLLCSSWTPLLSLAHVVLVFGRLVHMRPWTYFVMVCARDTE